MIVLHMDPSATKHGRDPAAGFSSSQGQPDRPAPSAVLFWPTLLGGRVFVISRNIPGYTQFVSPYSDHASNGVTQDTGEPHGNIIKGKWTTILTDI